MAVSGVAIVKKGWYVQWEQADPVPLPDGSIRYRKMRRKFAVLDSAHVFAGLIGKQPDVRNAAVVNRNGKDKVGLGFPKEVPPKDAP